MEFFTNKMPSRRGYEPINENAEPEKPNLGVGVSTELVPKLRTVPTDLLFRNVVVGFLALVVVLFVVLLFSPGDPESDSAVVVNLRQAGLSSNEIVVNITQGSLLGKRMQTRDGREYLALLGIPYAKPPVKELRFKPPQPAEGWSGIRNATAFGSECVQDGRQGGWRGTKGREDCLNLNVYTPKTLDDLRTRAANPTGNLFPVLVYFHGGGLAGNVFYNGGEYLLDEDVILVTLHYRLGVFGMLNVHTSAARGNQGLKDQAMALKWIQANIAAFGGDASRVLLFGESSGSSSITAHLVSPMSTGLFSRGICESGTILDKSLLSQNPLKNAFDLGRKLNCSLPMPNQGQNQDEDVESLMECLMNLEAEQLVVTTAEAFTELSFLYSVESWTEEEKGEVFLSDTPLNLFQSGVSSLVPMMFGVNNQEGISASLMLLKLPAFMDAYNANWTAQAINSLHILPHPNNLTMEPEQIANAIHDFYFGTRNNMSLENSQNITDMFSDRDFTHPTYLSAYFTHQACQRQREESSKAEDANVYMYYLTEQVPQSYWVEVFSNSFHLTNITIEDVKGAGHVDELQYLYQNAGYNYPEIPPGSPQYNFSKMLVHLWTSFAASGVPDTAGYGGKWEPVSGARPFQWYEIHGSNSKMTDVLHGRMNFWDSFVVTDLYV